MWALVIIAAVVIIYPKLGYKLTDEIEKLLYIDDDCENNKSQETEESSAKNETPSKVKEDYEKENVIKPNKTPSSGKKVHSNNRINPIEKANIKETEESKKSASAFMKNVYKGGMS